MDYFNAFWVGGLICALVQILLDKTKLMPGQMGKAITTAAAIIIPGIAVLKDQAGSSGSVR